MTQSRQPQPHQHPVKSLDTPYLLLSAFAGLTGATDCRMTCQAVNPWLVHSVSCSAFVYVYIPVEETNLDITLKHVSKAE